MSKLPKISSYNSDSLKNALGLINNGNDVYNITETEENENKNFNNLINLPPINNNQIVNRFPQTNKTQNTFHPLITESKINDLETKFIQLEQTNSILNDRLRTNERNFEIQFKTFHQALIDEKDNRLKVEKLLGFFTDQSSISSNELKNKINLMQEILEKEEKWKFEQRQHDIELYKNLIGKLTDKVSETVKLEIDARFKADLDNKAMTQNLAQKLFAEMDVVRKEMDELNTETKSDLKESSKECSERAHNLSKYIDMSMSEAVLLPNQNLDKLKLFISKLADQIKNNMSSQHHQNKLFDERLTNLELFDQNLKEEIYKFVNSVEERLIRKNKDLKNYTDINIRKNFEILNNRTSELSKNTDGNIKILSNQLIMSRNKINSKLEDHIKLNKNQFLAITEDLEAMTNRVYMYEDLLEDYNRLNETTKIKIDKDLSHIQSKLEINIINERLLHKIEVDEIQSDLDTVRNNLIEFGEKIHNDIAEIIKNFESNFMNLVERSKVTFDQMNLMAENNIQMFKEFELTVNTIHEENDKIEMNNLMNQMLNKIEEENVHKEIENCKQVEQDLYKNVLFMKENLRILDSTVKNNKINNDVTLVMKEMLNKIESDENLQKQNKLLENLEKNEAVMKESIEIVERKVEIIRDQERELETTIQSINSDFSKLQEEIKNKNSRISKQDENGNIIPQEEIEKIQEELIKMNKLIENMSEMNKIKFSEIDIKNSLDEMLNKIEFNNLYNEFGKNLKQNEEKNEGMIKHVGELNGAIDKLDKELTENNETTKKVLVEYNAVIDAKISTSLERIKKENLDMWTNAVELSQKVNQPEGNLNFIFILEIRRIIQQVPPVVIPKEESMRKIYEIEHDDNKQPKPELLKLKEIQNTSKDINKKQDEDIKINNIDDKNLTSDKGLKKDLSESNKNIEQLKK